MTKKTHQAGGMLISIVGFAFLRENGLLLPEVHEGLQWLVIYPFCMWGSTANDSDHHWDSCPNKDYPNWLINKALHITAPLQKSLDKTLSDSKKSKNVIYQTARCLNARHRSWQTHSDLTIWALLFLYINLVVKNVLCLSAVETSILALVLTGVVLGIIAHLILDVLTPEGIWLMPFVWVQNLLKLFNPRLKLPKFFVKFHLVPNNPYFATGGKWEEFIQKVLKVATVIALIWFLFVIFYPYLSAILPFTISFNLGG